MSGVIELQVHGDVAACSEAVRTAGTAATAVEGAGTDVDLAVTDSASWTGAAADGFRGELSRVRTDLSDLRGRVDDARRALSTFIDELAAVEHKMADVRDFAAGHGLAVSGDTVTAPSVPADGAGQEAVDAHNERVRHWNSAVEMARDARTREDRAHEQLSAAMQQTNGDGWFEDLLEKLGIAPPDGMDAGTGGAWLVGLGATAFGVQADAMGRAVLGRWQPWFKGPQGWRLGSPYGHSAATRLRLGLRTGATAARDWRAQPYQSAARGRWSTAGKWAGRVGAPLTALTSGWTQWQADADDPSLDGGERADRAVTSGLTTAGGALAGAKGGALVGGAIGTMIFPGAGTVVGGAIGGLIGGVGGAMAGDAVGDFVNEQWDGAAHAVGEGVDWAGDQLADAGDALTFWD